MKIDEFSIRSYGPLPDMNRVKLGKFTLFFGQNEKGKTMIIDALIRLLFKKHREFGEGVLRVDESPDGHIMLEENGKKFKLPEKGDLTKLFDISAWEGRNIFIIRDSDLTLFHASDHYRKITYRLTGLRSEEIGKIVDKLHEIGKLTPQGDFLNRSPELLKGRIKKADEVIRKIEEIAEQYKKEDIEQLEKELVDAREKQKRLRDKLKLLEMARNRRKYEKGSDAIEAIKKVRKELQALENLDEENEQAWRVAERDIKKDKEEKRSLLLRLRRKEKELDGKEGGVKNEERELKILENTKKKIDEDIRPAIRNYEDRLESFQSTREKSRFFNTSFIISSILLIISITGLFVIPAIFVYLAVLFFLTTLFSGWNKYQITGEEGKLKGMFEKMQLEASKYKLQGSTIEEIIHNIQKFEDKFLKDKERINEMNKKIAYLKSETDQINKQISDREKSLERAEAEIEEIKARSEINTLDTYTKNLKMKKDKVRFQEKYVTILDDNFGTKGRDLEDKIVFWEREIASFEKYKTEAKRIKYDEKEESRLNEEDEKLSETISVLDSKFTEFRKELQEIERAVNEILALESDYLYCQTTKDLHAVKGKLEDFLTGHEERRRNALEAIGIFEKIMEEEEQKVSNLFGKDSSISKHFSEITGGNYTEVNFHPEEKKISAKMKNGELLDADKLSGGAYDQLYLAIRLGLGEQLLKGNKGFFIMDDPFVKSDKDRLKRQIKILKNIAEMGWQIVYFTAKDEVKELFDKDIRNNNINLIELPGIQI